MENSKYKYTDKCGEISGFGGSYEEACRDLVTAGMEWFDINPNADVKFKGMKNVFGLIHTDSEDAKRLDKHLCDSCKDLTGAMHQASVGHILKAQSVGWEEYIKLMEERGDDK